MNAAAMLALQEIDTAIDGVSNRRPRLPEVAAHAQAAATLSALDARRAALQQRIDAAQASIDGAESASHDLTTRRTRLETQLKTVIAPREAEALMNQIATLNAQRGELDEQELAALEEQAAAEAELVEVAAEEPAAAMALETARTALSAANEVLDREAGELAAARETAAAMLTADEVVAYEQARRHFDGVAVAHLEGSRCSGCHLDLSPAELDVVKATPAGEPAECPQCARFLVR
jgi:predicted  nucleic acid-binding Zn-ribbon protein